MATTTDFVKAKALGVLTATLTYADTTAVKLFTLPKNAIIVDIVVNVQTAFSGGTTQVNLGTTTTATEILAALTVSSKGRAAITTTLSLPGHKTTTVTDIYGVVGASNTVGQAQVNVLFTIPQNNFLGG